MITLKERFDKNFGVILPQMGVEASQISSLLSFFRQELLALAEEVEKTKQKIPNWDFGPDGPPTGFPDEGVIIEEEKIHQHNSSIKVIATLIRLKADELV